MKLSGVIFILLYTIILTSPVLADNYTVREISLEEALFIIDSQSPEIISARMDADNAKEDIRIAGRIPNPVITSVYGFGSIYSQLANPQEVSFNQLIEIGKRSSRIKLAKANYNIVQTKIRSSIMDIHTDIRAAYIDLYFAKHKLAILKKQKILYDMLLCSIKGNKTSDKRVNEDIRSIELTIDRLSLEIDRANVRYHEQRELFNEYLNSLNRGNVIFDVPDFNSDNKIQYFNNYFPLYSEPLPDIEELIMLAFKYRGDILTAKSQFEAAKKTLDLAKGLRIPDLQFGTGYLYSTLPGEVLPVKTFYQGFYLQGGLTVPLFHNQGAEINKAKIALDQAKLAIEAAKGKGSKAVRESYYKLKNSQDKLKSLNESLLDNKIEEIDNKLKLYSKNKEKITQLLESRNSLQKQYDEFMESIYGYFISWNNILNEIGLDGFNL